MFYKLKLQNDNYIEQTNNCDPIIIPVKFLRYAGCDYNDKYIIFALDNGLDLRGKKFFTCNLIWNLDELMQSVIWRFNYNDETVYFNGNRTNSELTSASVNRCFTTEYDNEEEITVIIEKLI
jgi:hypothetical protein